MPDFYVKRFKATKAEDAAIKVTADSAKAAVEMVHGSSVIESVNVTVRLFYQVALTTDADASMGYSPVGGQNDAGGVVDDLPAVREQPQRKWGESSRRPT